MQIPFFDYKRQLKTLQPEINKAVEKVLNSGKLILGDEVEKFENRFSQFIGAKYGVGVNSGTDAIKIALRSLDIGKDDEIITVDNTAVPTISAIREIGAIPKLVDIKENFTIDETKIKKEISQKTRAILPVHLYGQSCNMSAILKIAKTHNLKVIEDCAQAAGAQFKNKRVGSFGNISCLSFYPTKNLGAYGDGGIILTSNKNLADRCRALRTYGMKTRYYANFEGYNSRLDEMQAAILNVKLRYLNQWNKRRQKIAQYYLNNIKNPKIILPPIKNIAEHVFHLFVIRINKRQNLIKYLSKSNVGYGIHYQYPIHLQKAYKFLGYLRRDFPITEKFANEVLSLPIFPELTKQELKYIVNKLNNFQ